MNAADYARFAVQSWTTVLMVLAIPLNWRDVHARGLALVIAGAFVGSAFIHPALLAAPDAILWWNPVWASVDLMMILGITHKCRRCQRVQWFDALAAMLCLADLMAHAARFIDRVYFGGAHLQGLMTELSPRINFGLLLCLLAPWVWRRATRRI